MNGSPDVSATALPGIRRTRIRVRYAETDQMGVAYYANFLVWFEVARVEWLRQGGWSYRDIEHDGTALPVIEAHCEYRHPARYDDEIEIAARGTLLTPVRVRFDYNVVRVDDDIVAAVGHTIHAAVDAGGKPRRLPQTLKDMLK